MLTTLDRPQAEASTPCASAPAEPPVSSYPALDAALAALAPLREAERAASAAHTASEEATFQAKRDGQKVEAAERAEAKAYKAWQRKEEIADKAVAAILLVPADNPEQALQKHMAFLKAAGCRINAKLRVDPVGDHSVLDDALASILRDLTQTATPPPPVSPADFAKLVEARNAAEQALIFDDDDDVDPVAAAASREAFRQAQDDLLNAAVTDPAAIARKLWESLADDVGNNRMTTAEIHKAILDAADDDTIDVRAPAAAYRDLVRMAAQPADPVAKLLAAADTARGDDEDSDVPDAYWAHLDCEIPEDATTPQGLLWRVARANHKAEAINQHNEGDRNEEFAEFISRELNSIARTLVRMGAKNTAAIAGNFVHRALDVRGPLIPAPVADVDGLAYAQAEEAYEAALAACDHPGVTDEELDEAGDREVLWLRSPAPNLRAVIKKMECEEAHRDAMGLCVDGQITETGDRNRPRGFLCRNWIAHIEHHGDGSDRARLAIFRDLLRLADIWDHPASPAGLGRIRPRDHLQVVVTPEQVQQWALEDQARQWVADYRASGGDIGPGPDGSVWIGTPLDDAAKEQACEAAQRELTPELRAAVRLVVAAEPRPAELTPDLGIEFIGSDQPERQAAALLAAMG